MISGKRVRKLGSIQLLYIGVVLLLSLSVTRAQEALNPVQVASYGRGEQLETSAWSPDGTTLVVAGTRGLWFYDVSNFQAEPEFLDIGYAWQLAYAPDGRLAVSVSRRVMVFDADRNVLTTFEGYRAAWSQDGALLAFHTVDDVFVLDTQTWTERYHLPIPAVQTGYAASDLTFSGDGRLLFLRDNRGVREGTAVWELGADSSTLLEIYFDNPDLTDTYVMALSPDGVTLVLGKLGGNTYLSEFRFLNIETHVVVQQSADDPIGARAAFSPDGRTLATWIWRQQEQVVLWTVNPWSEQLIIQDAGEPAFNPDGSLLALSNGVYDTQTGEQLLAYAPQPRFSASPDGMTILEQSDSLRLLNPVTGEVIATLRDVPSPFSRAQFSPDGRWLLTWHDDRTVYLWDTRTGDQQAQLADGDIDYPFHEFSPDMSLLVLQGNAYDYYDTRFGIWDLVDNQRIPLPTDTYVGHNPTFTARSEVVLETRTFELSLWQPRTNQRIAVRRFNGFINGVTFSDDSSLLAYSDHHEITIFDIATSTEIAHLALPDDLLSIGTFRFSADNAYFSYTLIFNDVTPGEPYIWNIATGEVIPEPPTETLPFLAQSERWGVVVSGNVLQLYAADAAIDDAPLAEIPRNNVGGEHIAFSPDDTYLLISYPDGVVVVWRLE